MTDRKKFYKTTKWRKCRDSYFKSVAGLCERCDEPGLIVHHKIYLTDDNYQDATIALNHSNLELLCQTCHNKEHFEKNSAIRFGYMFDSSGQLVKKS
ncbi:MAG: HNH endonuclease [Bacilli bacterium]